MYLLLDLDNTILPSKEAYTKAINGLSIDWEQRGLGSQADFLSKYEVARNLVKTQLGNHSSNRLRLLCFKNMLDTQDFGITGKQIELLLWLEERYFYHFTESLRISRETEPRWKELFSVLSELFEAKQVCVLTNENLRTQLFKIKAFFPEELKWNLLTSEEIGIEKPHPDYFAYALKRVAKKSNECMMIGDNRKDDVDGANAMDIAGIHLTAIFGSQRQLIELPEMNRLGVGHKSIVNLETDNILTAIEYVRNK